MIKYQKPFFKLVIIGDGGVGKTSLIERLCDDSFSENYHRTIGADFKFKTFSIDGKQVKLQIWDTAGHEKFRNLTFAQYRSADDIILVYDVSDEVSFNNIQNWVKEVENHEFSEVQLMLIGNKIDMDKKQVSTETAQQYAQSNQMEFFEVSAKTSDSVTQAFLSFARKIKNKKESMGQIREAEQTLISYQQGSQNQTLSQSNLEAKKEKDSCW